jgi:hypothetical protein
VRQRHVPGDRRDIDHDASRLPQVGQGEAGEQQRCRQVGVDHGRNRRRIERIEGTACIRGGIVHQHVNVSVHSERPLDERREVRELRDVGGHRKSVEFARECLDLFSTACRQHHAGTGPIERLCRRGTHTRRGAGHDHDFARECLGHRSLLMGGAGIEAADWSPGKARRGTANRTRLPSTFIHTPY